MSFEAIANWILAAGIVIGVFFMAYMTYRQQGLIETINEIKEAFEDKAEGIADTMVYK